jgi:SAM-dependent methyltransferase
MSTTDPALIDAQEGHWGATFAASPDMYGTGPSGPAAAAAAGFAGAGVRVVLELGAGQGRDTLFLARQGFDVVAVDYAGPALEAITAQAAAGPGGTVRAVRHDVREPLPFPASRFDASYSHMLFCMALTTPQLERLAAELHRVIRPGGLVVYTVRHTGDAHYGTGTPRGDACSSTAGSSSTSSTAAWSNGSRQVSNCSTSPSSPKATCPAACGGSPCANPARSRRKCQARPPQTADP